MPEITITLNAGYEKVNPTNPFGMEHPLLYHQHRTYDALKTNDLVINTYNTGTGKTLASMLRLFDLKDENVLFIAPTNELIHQHANDIRAFVQQHGLNFAVAEVTGKRLREWEIIDDSGYPVRNPRKLHELIQNPRDYFPELTQRSPLILVTNPDLFYLSFYSVYSKKDRPNLFHDFLLKFNYVVIDEFHYYNAKQLTNFLIFFTLSNEYGYFKHGRKICLLSATPDEKVLTYLEKIGLTYALIRPENEPAESIHYPQIQTLSPLELTIHSSKMQDALTARPELVRNFLEAEQEGAIISSSLRTINEIKQILQKTGMQAKIGLITGAVSPEERDAAKHFPCVLATPTVDIGYNFQKARKSRQNIDFICFDALCSSEFIQRLGRAGRLLGKQDTNQQSIGHAFVEGSLYSQLQKGTSYERAEFARIAKDSLGEDNRFYHYIHSYAILEAFQPLYEHFKRTLEERQDRVREIFDTIRQIFAPESHITFDEMMRKFRWHATYEIVKDKTYNDYVQHQWERAAWSYCRHQSWINGTLDRFEKLSKEDEKWVLEYKLKNNRSKIIEHAKQEYCLVQSLFNFRSSNVGIRCGIYDPNHLFQNTAKHTEYDLFHILTHYKFDLIPNRKKYYELTSDWGNYCEFFVNVRGFKKAPERVQFNYDASVDQESFERQYCRGPAVLKGLRLGLSNNGYVPLEIQGALTDQYIPCLLSKMENRYVLNSILETQRQVSYRLSVTFSNRQQKAYQLILGSQAFLIHAELQGKWEEKKQSST